MNSAKNRSPFFLCLAALLWMGALLPAAHAQPFTVTYNGNGADGGSTPTDANSPYANGALVTVLSNNSGFTFTGNTFLAWNTAADGSGNQYSGGQQFNITANTTLFAQWVFTGGGGGGGGGGPVLTAGGGAAPTYTAGGSAVVIDSGITVADTTSTTIASGSVSISNPGTFLSGDRLNFSTQNGVTGTYDSSTGILTLTGSATLANYQTALRSVTFDSTSGNPTASGTNTSRTIGFSVTDSNNAASTPVNSSVTVAAAAATAPTVTSPTNASVAGTSATLGGNVTSDGGATVSARGVVYSITSANANPQLSGTGVTNATTSGTTGVFTVAASSLTPGTGYSYAAYATNSSGTSYSSVGTFTTLSANADLSALALSSGTLFPTFAAGTTSYTASVANATASLTVTPTANQANATIKVNGTSVASATASGAITLNVGANTITTVVTAQDGTTTKTYTVTVTRAASNDATLSALALSSGTLSSTFAAGTTTYTASVANATTSLTVTPTVSQANATIKVNSTTVASGVASGPIALNVGSNTVTTVVTAQDGTTTKTYTVTVTRAAATPTISSVTAPAGGTYTAGQQLNFTVTFSSAVTVTGTPSFSVTIGSNTTRTATYVSGSGTTALVFRYTVTLGDNAATGISVASPIALNGGTIIGTNTLTAGLTFTPPTTTAVLVSTAPVLTASAGSTAFTSGNNVASTPVAVDSGITLTDPSLAALPSTGGALVSITGNYQSAEDVLAFTNSSVATYGDISGTFFTTGFFPGALYLTSPSGAATLAQWQAALRAVTYTSTAITPNTTARTVSFMVNDGTQDSNTVTKTVTVTATNQTPVVTTSAGSGSFYSFNGATVVDSGLTVTDRNNPTLASATVSITGNFRSTEDVLSLTSNAATMGNIAGSYNSATGALTLTSSGATATLAQWQAALRAVTYNDTAGTPNTPIRTISFVVNDGTTASAAATKSMTVAGAYSTGVEVNAAAATVGSIGKTVSLTAKVTSDSGGTVSTGTVTFTLLNSGTVIGQAVTSGTIASGTATVSYAVPGGTAVGRYSIQAVYNAGGSFAGSSDTSQYLTVTAIPSTTVTVSGTVTSKATVSSFASGLNHPEDLAFDKAGNLYVSKYIVGVISKVATNGTVSSFASGLNRPEGLAFDTDGNLYVANSGNNTISKVTPAGVVSTFVSSGLSTPIGLAFDAAGSLYVSNYQGDTISKVTSNGTVSPFVSSEQKFPFALAIDAAGNLYVSNIGNLSISKVTPGGAVSAFVSSGLSAPQGLAVDAAGNLYVSDVVTNTISKVTPGGAVSTFVSSGLSSPQGLVFDKADNLYVANSATNTIGKATITSSAANLTATIASTGGTVNSGTVTFTLKDSSNSVIGTPVASVAVTNGTATASYDLPTGTVPGSYTIQAVYNSTGAFDSSNGTGSLAISAAQLPPPKPATTTTVSGTITSKATATTFVSSGLSSPSGLAIDAAGTLYVGNLHNNTISKVTSSGTVSTFVSAGLREPNALAIDAAGTLYVGSNFEYTISKVTSSGTVSTFVSSGLSNPKGLAIDAAGTLYVANLGNGTISKVTSSGTVSTFVSSGLSSPYALAIDAAGTLYVANLGNDTISKVTSSGTVSTFVSSGLRNPDGLAVDAAGTLYVANTGNNTISKVVVATVADLTATVASTAGTVNTGTVTFTLQDSNGTTVGTPVTSATVSAGTATATYTLPAGTSAGSLRVVATYNPGATLAGSTGTTSVQAPTKPTFLPIITSSLTATGTYGASLGYQIAADNSPTSYSATPLPSGLTFDSGTGRFGGKINAPSGTYAIAISATNADGTTTRTLNLTVNKAKQVITWRSVPDLKVGDTAALVASATSGLPVSYTASAGGTIVPGPTFRLDDASKDITITASVDGNDYYLPATKNQIVTKKTPVILTATAQTSASKTQTTYTVMASSPTTITMDVANNPFADSSTVRVSKFQTSNTTTTFTVTAIASNAVLTGDYNAYFYADNIFAAQNSTLSGSGSTFAAQNGTAGWTHVIGTGTKAVVPGSSFSFALSNSASTQNFAPPPTSTFSLSNFTSPPSFNNGTAILPAAVAPGDPGVVDLTFALRMREVPVRAADTVTPPALLAATVDNVKATATFIGYLPELSAGFYITLPIAADGTFSGTTAALLPGGALGTILTFTGVYDGVTISGSIPEAGRTFRATADPATGSTAAGSGFYAAPAVAASSGAVYSIVGTDGRIVSLTVSQTGISAGTGAVKPDNTFSVQQIDSNGQAATIAGSLSPDSGNIEGKVTFADQTSQSFQGIVDGTPAASQLANASSRGFVGTGSAGVFSTGFVITGTTPKTVVLRGAGPSLATFGVSNFLATPHLWLYDSQGTLLADNNGWDASAASTFKLLGAFPFAAGSRDAAIIKSLQPGAYSVVVTGDGATGVMVMELYDPGSQGPGQRLVNISGLGQVNPAAGGIIDGFIVSGNSPERVLIRGIGPALTAYGVTGAVADPVLLVYNSAGQVIARNDNWQTPISVNGNATTASTTEISAAASATGAFPLPAGSKDAAMLLTLAPGAYTAVVMGANGTSGIGLAEVYELP